MELKIKGIQLLEREIDTLEYNVGFRDVEKFEQLCRECRNYGCRWGCPPFSDNPQPDLRAYRTTRLFLLKIDLEPESAESQKEMAEVMQRAVQKVRTEYEARMLEMEKKYNGRSALFTGMCPHCGEAQCARMKGQKCRHPELVRPSLEALGFDIGRTASELMGVELKWATDEKAPAYMCLVGAVFY